MLHLEGRGEMFVREVPGGEVPGGEVDHGSPVVVLLHGWTLSADLNWFAGGYQAAAAHGRRVIAPDIRGHGRGLRTDQRFTLEDAADDIAALVRAMAGGPAVLAGYSMGGSIALLCAARHPDVTAGLVLASCGLRWRGSARERFLWLTLGFAEYGMRLGAPKGITGRYLRHAVEQSPDLEPYLAWVRAESRRGDVNDLGHAAKALAAFDARRIAEQINVPAAVVVTDHDGMIDPRAQRALAGALRCPTVPVDGCHDAWLVQPDAWNGALDSAISDVVARSSSERDQRARRPRSST